MCNTVALNKHWKYRYHGKHGKGAGRFSKWDEWQRHLHGNHQRPPANVRELDDKYELYLFAPGYEKGDFLIALMDDTLSVSVEKTSDQDGNWKRKEFSPAGFIRQFQLNEKIDKESIVAKYENGVLILSLPKMEGFETMRKEIEVD